MKAVKEKQEEKNRKRKTGREKQEDLNRKEKAEKSSMEDSLRDSLIQAALDARKTAYAPYSRFRVGAALLTAEGDIFTGGNIENASYGATNCAERTAIFKAVSEGHRNFRAIAIAGGMEDGEPTDYAYPCGICRQVMSEFAESEFTVIIAKSVSEYKEYQLGELLPCSFGGESIK